MLLKDLYSQLGALAVRHLSNVPDSLELARHLNSFRRPTSLGLIVFYYFLLVVMIGASIKIQFDVFACSSL